ncbi:MAG: hypothetical protein K1X68_06615 [Saprospiraceae bacterium]|nr:hypothetical protein [Saprospiraceae bacterium]
MILLTLIFLDTVTVLAQYSIWPILSGVKYKKVSDPLLGYEVDYPVFNDEIKSIEGRRVKVRGFIVPTNGYKSSREFVLSALPVKSCYFCGGAGPETVIEIRARQDIPVTAERVELEGRFRLNSADLNRLMFQLEDAILVSP